MTNAVEKSAATQILRNIIEWILQKGFSFWMQRRVVEEGTKILFLCGRNILSGQSCAFAKKILFHLFYDHFLIFAAGGIQAVFIQKHLAELGPARPRLAGNLIINFVPQVCVERRLVQSGKFFVKLGAENLVLGHNSPQFHVPENYLIPR